jgi:transcriptional regulator with XRE-family HTH domain
VGWIGDLADVIRSHVGIGLRRARLARGWSLRAAAEASSGRFAASSIAGYERGERAISLERFVELCRLYAVSSERLLASTERAASDGTPPIVDLGRFERLGDRTQPMIALFVDQVIARRGQPPAGRIALRAGDVQLLASVAGISSDELIEGRPHRERSSR